jgi:hypothetical protein
LRHRIRRRVNAILLISPMFFSFCRRRRAKSCNVTEERFHSFSEPERKSVPMHITDLH